MGDGWEMHGRRMGDGWETDGRRMRDGWETDGRWVGGMNNRQMGWAGWWRVYRRRPGGRQVGIVTLRNKEGVQDDLKKG